MIPVIGLYSVILEVSDNAGNTAMARTFVLYEPFNVNNISTGSRIDVLEDRPLDISGAVLIDSIYWIVQGRSNLQIQWVSR